jgi:hypothetical protein
VRGAAAGLGLVVVSVLQGGAARAQSGPPGLTPTTEPTPRDVPTSGDYTSQIALTDAVGLLAGLGFAATDLRGELETTPPRLGAAASVHYGFSLTLAPAVHAARGRFGLGVADLGLRAAIPPLAAGLVWPFYCIASNDDDQTSGCDDHSGLAAGFVAGSIAAAALDALVLARAPSYSEPEPRGEWYGWQIAASDAAILAFIAYRSTTYEPDPGEDSQRPLSLLIGHYALGWIAPPIIHAAHGRWKNSVGSAGARLLVPPLFSLAGIISYCASTVGEGDDCEETGALGGIFFGALSVAALDIVLASEPGTGQLAADRSSRSWAGSLVPTLQVDARGGLLGATGRW